MSIEGQGYFLTLAPGHLHMEIKTCFSKKLVGYFLPNCVCSWVDLDLFYGKVKFGNLGFSIGKFENSGFLETIEACDLKVGRCRQLIELMKV